MSIKTALLGFGNPVREDDGVGIHVIEQLKNRIGDHPDFNIFDMGTSAFEVLFKLKGHDRIILIDAVMNSEEPVGSIFKLPASEVEAKVVDDPLVFLHGLKWDQALSYARKILLDEYPENIQVYLIAIESIRFNLGMSEPARKGADRLVDVILEDLKLTSANSI